MPNINNEKIAACHHRELFPAVGTEGARRGGEMLCEAGVANEISRGRRDEVAVGVVFVVVPPVVEIRARPRDALRAELAGDTFRVVLMTAWAGGGRNAHLMTAVNAGC